MSLNRKWTADEEQELRRLYRETHHTHFSLREIADKLKRPYYGVAMRASRLGLGNYARAKSERHVRSMKAAMAGQWSDKPHPRGMAGKTHGQEARAVMSDVSKRMWKSHKATNTGLMRQELRQTRSDRMVKRQQENPKMRKGYSRGAQGRRADLGGMHFRSSWEANYARYLNHLIQRGKIQKWEFEPDTFWFEEIKRGVRSYLPDFKVWDKDGNIYYVEVKGWMDDKSATKLKRMKKYHPHITIKLVDAKKYSLIDKAHRDIIPNWEGKGRKTEEPALVIGEAPQWLNGETA